MLGEHGLQRRLECDQRQCERVEERVEQQVAVDRAFEDWPCQDHDVYYVYLLITSSILNFYSSINDFELLYFVKLIYLF